MTLQSSVILFTFLCSSMLVLISLSFFSEEQDPLEERTDHHPSEEC